MGSRPLGPFAAGQLLPRSAEQIGSFTTSAQELSEELLPFQSGREPNKFGGLNLLELLHHIISSSLAACGVGVGGGGVIVVIAAASRLLCSAD